MSTPCPTEPDQDEYIEVEWEVVTITDERFNEETCTYEYLVKWKNWEGDTWEPEEAFQETAKGLLEKWQQYQEALTAQRNEERRNKLRNLMKRWRSVQKSSLDFEKKLRKTLNKHERRVERLEREVKELKLLKQRNARKLRAAKKTNKNLAQENQALEKDIRKRKQQEADEIRDDLKHLGEVVWVLCLEKDNSWMLSV